MDVTFNRQTVITFPDNADLPDITTGIAEGSLYVDEALFTDRFTVGLCPSNRFEVNLYNFPMIGKEKIYVYQIIDEEEGTSPINKPIFTGYVDKCTTNRGRFEDSKYIVAYDPMYSKGTEDVSAWWEEVFDTATRVTVKELRDTLCEFVGISYDDVTLPNDGVYITQTQQLNNISFQAMLGYILQINACNAKFDASGVLHFFTILDDAPIDIEDTYAQNTSEFDSYTVPTYESVRITNTTENITTNTGTGENYYHIVDNLLLLKKTQLELEAIAMNVLVTIHDISYAPASIDMIYSNPDIHVGHRVKIGVKTYLVCENIRSGTQLVDQHINSNGSNAIEQSSTSYDATTKDIQESVFGASMKYYRYQSQSAQEFTGTKPILTIRYTSSAEGVIFFHGCVIVDVAIIDNTKPGVLKIQYSIDNNLVREYTPTETYYHDGRYTLNLMHFWECVANRQEKFVVYLTAENCRVTIGAFRNEGYMEGMGLVGDAIWDGLIENEENVTPFSFKTAPGNVAEFGEEVTVNAIAPISLEFTVDMSDGVDFSTVPTNLYPISAVLNFDRYPLHEHTWEEVGNWTWEAEGIYDEEYEKYYAW